MRRATDVKLSYVRVLGPFVVAMAVLVALCLAGFHVLSAVRAFVGGESLWSKSRAMAVAQLHVYAATHSPQAYERFQAALVVPLGDRQAREAMALARPDFALARDGFLRGGNHPDDVDAMVWLHYCFGGTELMREALQAWAEGDRLIAELRELGQQLMQRPADPAAPGAGASGTATGLEQAALLARLDGLEDQLIAQEKRFSASLGVASRKTLLLLTGVIALLAAVLAYAGTSIAHRALRHHAASQQQLAQANRRWTLATAGEGMGLFEWNIENNDLHLDARACALYGFVPGPDGLLIKRSELRALLHPDDLGPVQKRLEQAAATGELFKQRYRVCRPDGSLRHLETTGIVHDDGPRLPTRMLGVVRDVSDEVLRGQLRFEKAAAERVARARIEFLSRLSHELRTPLNAVLGFAQLLLADKSQPLSAPSAARVQHIAAAGDHLLHLVEDVLDVTKIDSGHLSVHLAPTALQPVTEAALRLVEKQQQALGIVISNTLPAQVLHVQADAHRLEQVLVNLLSNACKYNSPGGRVTLAHRVDGASVLVSVQDEGDGLSAQELAQLFQPFKRLSHQPGIEGTGLGLVIVKLLLEQMGGGIEVASVKGQGSTFTLRLPLIE